MSAPSAPLMLRSVEISSRTVAIKPKVRRPAPVRRLLAALVALVIGLTIAAYPTAASADPGEGLSDLFVELGQAQQAYLDAKALLDASVARQQQLTETLATADEKMAGYQQAVGVIAHRGFVSSGFTSVTGILTSGAGSSEQLLDVLSIDDALSTHETNEVRALREAVAEANALQASIDAEVAAQTAALQEMEAKKEQAENALWRTGSAGPASGFGGNASVVAEPAPRNADGSWSKEERSVWEPNTSNYITPRVAHARDEAIKAGFSNWAECYYGGGSGEHPKGRACDFAVDDCRFCGDAQGAAKQYGTDLAAFFVFNAQRLGVLYVIWYRQIWLPSSGWRSYSGCCTSSQKHTNHVHLSVY